jgi:hypothetical protein
MRLLRILPQMAIMMVALASVATAAISPGTPCSDLGQPAPGSCVAGDRILSSARFALEDILFDLVNDPGTLDLGIFVVPGDVVLFEHPGGSMSDPTTWSDVVRFTTGTQSSSATIFADGETGVILPPGFQLSANAVSIVEVQNGTGTDADFTVYIAGTATYQIHSDAALTPEPFEPGEAPELSTLTLFIGGSLLLVGFARRRRLL